jgi:hypothetical protein
MDLSHYFDTVKIQTTYENVIIIKPEINPPFNITAKELYYKYHFLILNKKYSTTSMSTYNYRPGHSIYILPSG